MRCVWETLTLSFKLIQHAAPASYPRSQSSVHRVCIWGNPFPSRSMWRRSRKSLHLDIRRDNVGWNRGRMGCLGTLVLSGCLGVSVLQQRRKGRKAGRVGCRGHSTHPELTGLHGFGRSPELSSRDVSVSVGEQEMPLSCGLL